MPAPAVDTGLCVRHRYHGATCRSCADTCPTDAIQIGRGIAIDPLVCTECGLCAPSCPNEALSGAGFDLAGAIPLLASRTQPVLGCRQNLASSGDARIRCFGGLDAKDLAILALQTGRPLTINAAPCHTCRAGADVLPVLRRRVAELTERGILPEGLSLAIREQFDANVDSQRKASRRGFLRLLGDFSGPNAVDPQPDPRKRRSRLGNVPQCAAPTVARWFLADAEYVPIKQADCDDCCRCAAICPTPALQRTRVEGRRRLMIIPTACTGCRVCVDFCPPQAISIDRKHALDICIRHTDGQDRFANPAISTPQEA